MDIWNPSEDDAKTEEYLKFHVHFLRSGGQQRSDWVFYPKYGEPTDRLAKPVIQRDHAFTEDNHYVLKGCNLHDKAQWIRYVRTNGDYSAKASSPKRR